MLKKTREYSDGMNAYGFRNEPYVDWDGKPVERTKHEHGYSYSAYVVYKKRQKYQHVVYSDRLFMQGPEKHDELCEKHFGDQGQAWSNRGRDKIELFLQDFYNDHGLELVGIMEGCNVGNGYPYWIFMFDCDFETSEDDE